MNPQLSVCIPTYNGAAHLGSCLASVLAQTYPDFELLIVDDGSTDATLQIAQEHARRDARIRIVRNPQRHGLPGNWDRCVALAQAPWIKFVFQDDGLVPSCLQRCVKAAENVEMVVCRRGFEFASGTSIAEREFYLTHPTLDDVCRGETRISPQMFRDAVVHTPLRNFVGEPTAVMLRRDVFSRFGPFNPNLVMLCDWEFWARIGVHTGLAYVPDTLATFRVHRASATARQNASNRYRVLLDEVIVLHEYAFNPTYAPLRQAAGVCTPPLDFRVPLARRAARLRKLATTALNHPANPNPSLAHEWNRFVQAFPQVAQLIQSRG